MGGRHACGAVPRCRVAAGHGDCRDRPGDRLRRPGARRTNAVSQTRLAASSPVAARHDLAATAAERAPDGTPGPRAGPPGRPRRMGRTGPRARPHRHADGPERIRLPELLPLRLPAHGALAVELLPRRGRGDGGRPRLAAAQPDRGPALRRRPRPELRIVGHPGAQPQLRSARLRRDAARALRVGRGAPGRQPGGGRPAERGEAGPGRCGRDGGGRRLPQPDAALRHAADPRHLVRGHAVRPLHRLLRTRRPRPGEGAVREGQAEADEPRRVRQADHGAARTGAHHGRSHRCA